MPAARISPAVCNREPSPWSPSEKSSTHSSPKKAKKSSEKNKKPKSKLSKFRQSNNVWGSEDGYTTSETSFDKNLDTEVTPYQRLVNNLTYNDRWQKEVALGRRIGFYRLRGDLGQGNFSQVKVGMHCLAKERVAIKILDKSKLDAKTQRMLTREISTMEQLHHPNAIRLYEVIETLSRVHLIMEYAPGGELFQKINSDGRYDEETAKIIFAQIASAIAHMHQHFLVHRDIKAENIFIAGHNQVKVGDYGFSTQIRYRDDALNTFCGSPPYAAPELFKDENYVGPYVDVWALGVLLFFIVTGLMPFKAQTVAALKKLILEGDFQMPSHVSEECSDLIQNILKQLPTDRLGMNEILTHIWLKGQYFPEAYAKYNLLPTEEAEATYTAEEHEARKQMKALGIDEDLMKECADRGARSAITGTYRILLHKIQTAALTGGTTDASGGDSESAGTGAAGTPSPGRTQRRYACNKTPAPPINSSTENTGCYHYRKNKTCSIV